MNMQLTPTQLVAYSRRQKFKLAIARAAADLQVAKLTQAAADRGRPVMPEAVPAETDPPRRVEPPLVVPNEPQEPTYPTIERIQRVVAADYFVTLADLKSQRRTRNVVLPRQIGMYLCRHLTLHSYPMVGRLFGGRDHTTVLHAERKIAILIRQRPEFSQHIDSLIAKISGEAV